MRFLGLSFVLLSSLTWAAPPRPAKTYDLLDVNWQVRLDPATYSFEGTVTNTVKLLTDADSARFDCLNLKVDEVTVNSKSTRHLADGKTLIVQLPKGTESGKTVKIQIRYHGSPEAGLYFIDTAHAYPAKTPMVYTQGEMEDNRNWLPTYDYPDDKATSEGTLNVPAGWSTLSNGRLISHETVSGREVFHWKMDQPHSTYLISFVAGPYTDIPSKGASIPVSAFVPKGLEEWGNVAFGGTAENVSFYERLTHVKYPWVKYSQSAVADFMFGGMENVTCTTQTIDTLHPQSLDGLRNSRELVAHELAHQWFGDLITASDWSHIWVNEGWASFLPPFFTREKEGQDAYDLERLDIFAGGLQAHENASRPMVYTGYGDAIEMFDNFAYPGGASRMFMLMHQVGEEKFWNATAAYLNEFRFKNVTTEDFFNSFSKSLGIDLENFRKQWFYTAAAPHLTLAKEDGRWVVHQSGQTFDLPLEYLAWKDGRATFKTVTISGQSTRLDTDAEAVVLDPAVWLMAVIRYDVSYSNDTWRHLFTASPNAAGKRRLAREFFGRLSAREGAALFNSEPSRAVRTFLIEQLEDPELVRQLSESSDDRIRSEAVKRLGYLASSPETISRLRALANSDNDDIALSATKSLVSLTNDALLVEAAFKRDSFSDEFRIYALDYWSGRDANRARKEALATLRQPTSEDVRVRAISVLGRLRDLPGEVVVFSALKSILAEHTFNARTTAIRALAAYGNKDAKELIRRFADHPLTFFRDAAKEALQQLGG
jgi:HEAT repeat protein